MKRLPAVNDLALNLRKARKEAGLTQAQVAGRLAQCGIHTGQYGVQRIEQIGRTSTDHLEALCLIFNTTPNDLMGY